MWRRWLLRLRGSRPYREPSYPHPDLSPSTRMGWAVRLRVFLTGQGAVDHREDLRGRWLLHRKLLMVGAAVLLAWLFARAAQDWHFLDG
jgi:hypothetical protein